MKSKPPLALWAIAALGGAVAVGVAGYFLYGLQAEHCRLYTRDGPKQESRAPQQHGGGRDIADPAGVSGLAVPSPTQAVPAAYEGAPQEAANTDPRAKERNEFDVIAQQVMGCAAIYMAIFTAIQIVVAVFGLFALYRSLRYTRDALELADQSAKATIKAAKATIDSVRVARDANRPFMSVSFTGVQPYNPEDRASPDEQGLTIRLYIINAGATAALVESQAAGLATVGAAEDPSMGCVRIKRMHWRPVLPTADIRGHWQLRTSGADKIAIRGRTADGFLLGYVRYRDQQSVMRRSSFIFRWSVGEDWGHGFRPASDHPLWFDREETEQERAQHEACAAAQPDA